MSIWWLRVMPVLIEVAAVDSGGGRRWHFGASPLLACQPSPGVQSPRPLWLPALPYIRQTLGLKHHYSTSFFCCDVAPSAYNLCVVFGGWRLSLRYRQAPGWRTAGSLFATESFRVAEFSSCGALSPEEVSGVPTSSQPQLTSGAPDAPRKCYRKMGLGCMRQNPRN